jgi:hypothetical protein
MDERRVRSLSKFNGCPSSSLRGGSDAAISQRRQRGNPEGNLDSAVWIASSAVDAWRDRGSRLLAMTGNAISHEGSDASFFKAHGRNPHACCSAAPLQIQAKCSGNWNRCTLDGPAKARLMLRCDMSDRRLKPIQWPQAREGCAPSALLVDIHSSKNRSRARAPASPNPVHSIRSSMRTQGERILASRQALADAGAGLHWRGHAFGRMLRNVDSDRHVIGIRVAGYQFDPALSGAASGAFALGADFAWDAGSIRDCAVMVRERSPLDRIARRHGIARAGTHSACQPGAGPDRRSRRTTPRTEFGKHAAIAPPRGHLLFIKIVVTNNRNRLGAADRSRVGREALPVGMY